MTPAQTEFLRQCIAADRYYRSAKERGDTMVHNDWRGVEIGAINGTNTRTAQVLEDAGLIEIVNLYGRNGFAFLGSYKPYDAE